jgi:hypothetical protein
MRTSSTFVIVAIACLGIAAPARSAEPYGLHAGGDFRKMTREQCNARAMAALREEQKFPNVEVTPDGFVLGWSEYAGVLVTNFPYRDGVVVLVTTASKDNGEAERLRNEVRDYVLDPKKQREDKSVRQASHRDVKPEGLAMHWDVSKRGLTPTARFFDAAASIAMEKHGMRSLIASKTMVFGGTSHGGVLAVLVPGGNETSLQVLTIGVGDDDKEAGALEKTVRDELLKVLFD